MLQAQGSSAHSCLFHIQQSPHCFHPQHKEMTTLHTKHTTLNTITHYLYTPNTLYVTNLSPRKIRHLCRCLYHCRCPSHNFPGSSATKLAACGHFRDKYRFYHFFLHQTQSKCDGKSMADIIYPKSGFGRASASGPSTQEVGQQSVKMQRTGPNHWQNPGPAHAAAGINPLVC